MLIDLWHQPGEMLGLAMYIQGGAIRARYAKHHLPNYAVFDEYRTFIPGDELLVVRIKGADVAIIVGGSSSARR